MLPRSGFLPIEPRYMEGVVTSSNRFSEVAAGVVANEINFLMGRLGRPINIYITPGNTMVGFLEQLTLVPVDWAGVRLWSIGEFEGISPFSSLSLNGYLQRFFLDLFRENEPRPEYVRFDEQIFPNIQSYLEAIRKRGGLDLGILGIGRECGELVLNLPGTPFEARMDKVQIPMVLIEEKGLRHSEHTDGKPRTEWFARVLGLGDVLGTRHLVLLARGQEKRPIISRALFGPITLEVPASGLQNHGHLVVVVDEAAVAGVVPYKSIEPGAASRLANFPALVNVCPFLVAEEILDRYLGLVVTENQLAEILGKIDFANMSTGAVERAIQLGILEYYHEHLAEILGSVGDSEGREAIDELFFKAVRVYELSLVRSEIAKRKGIFREHLLLNIRPRGSTFGSQERSEAALALTINDVLASTDVQVFMPALESVFEILIYARKQKVDSMLQKAMERVLERMRFLPRFAWRLVDLLVSAYKQNVSLEYLKWLEFYHGVRQEVLAIARQYPALAHEMAEYLGSFSETNTTFGGAAELIRDLGIDENPT